MSSKTSSSLKWALRAYSVLAGLLGIGFVTMACIIQNPPSSALPIGLVILGAASLALCFFGFFHSFCTRACLSVFLLVSTVVTLAQLVLVITLFINLDSTVKNLVGKPTSKNKDETAKVEKALKVGRYVFLVTVVLEFVVLMATIVLRVRNPHASEPEDFDEQQAARSAMAQIQMEGLKHSMQRTASKSPAVGAADGNFYTASSKLYKSVTKKMSEKYGEFTQDPAFQATKWWQKNPFK